MEEGIQVVSMSSNQIEIENEEDKLDILISELLDSALLGEGVLFTHSDVIQRLLKSSIQLRATALEGPQSLSIQNRVLPHDARVYGTLIQSYVVESMQSAHNLYTSSDLNYFRDETARYCRGGRKLIPVHWHILESNPSNKTLSDPTELLHLEFFHVSDHFSDSKSTRILVTGDGVVHGVMLWWTLYLLSPDMDPSRSVSYSTEPGKQNWQDHWLQVVFPLDQPIVCRAGDSVAVTVSHNGTYIWIEAAHAPAPPPGAFPPPPPVQPTESPVALNQYGGPHSCGCGWHILYSSERFESLNDSARGASWQAAMLEVASGLVRRRQLHIAAGYSGREEVVMDVSDGSYLSLLLAAQLRASGATMRVASRELKDFSRILHQQITVVNDLCDTLMIWDGVNWSEVERYFLDDEVSDSESGQGNGAWEVLGNNGPCGRGEGDAEAMDVVVDPEAADRMDSDEALLHISALVSECFYFQMHSQPTWQALSFHYTRRFFEIRMCADAVVCPMKARVMVAAVELLDLAVSRGRVGWVRGFDHSALDACQKGWERHSFPYKLGSYQKRFLSQPHCVAEINYINSSISPPGQDGGGDWMESLTSIPVVKSGRLDCFAIWIDYQLTPTVELNHFDPVTEDFPHYFKLVLRFVATPVVVVGGTSPYMC
eukprot:gene3651-4555_t